MMRDLGTANGPTLQESKGPRRNFTSSIIFWLPIGPMGSDMEPYGPYHRLYLTNPSRSLRAIFLHHASRQWSVGIRATWPSGFLGACGTLDYCLAQNHEGHSTNDEEEHGEQRWMNRVKAQAEIFLSYHMKKYQFIDLRSSHGATTVPLFERGAGRSGRLAHSYSN